MEHPFFQYETVHVFVSFAVRTAHTDNPDGGQIQKSIENRGVSSDTVYVMGRLRRISESRDSCSEQIKTVRLRKQTLIFYI